VIADSDRTIEAEEPHRTSEKQLTDNKPTLHCSDIITY